MTELLTTTPVPNRVSLCAEAEPVALERTVGLSNPPVLSGKGCAALFASSVTPPGRASARNRAILDRSPYRVTVLVALAELQTALSTTLRGKVARHRASSIAVRVSPIRRREFAFATRADFRPRDFMSSHTEECIDMYGQNTRNTGGD